MTNRKYLGSGEQIPDTMYIKLDSIGRTCRLDIFDAKYYVPSMNHNNGQIYGMPASSDISKQVGYLLFLQTYMNGINDEYIGIGEQPYEISYSNHFLIPKSDTILSFTDEQFAKEDLYKECGEVSIGSFSKLLCFFDNLIGREKNILNRFNMEKLMNVGIIVVDPENLYRLYLNNPIEKIIL